MDFSILFTWDGFLYLIILSLLEIVLGIDNIIFISIFTDKLPKKKQRYARNIGLIDFCFMDNANDISTFQYVGC